MASDAFVSAYNTVYNVVINNLNAAMSMKFMEDVRIAMFQYNIKHSTINGVKVDYLFSRDVCDCFKLKSLHSVIRDHLQKDRSFKYLRVQNDDHVTYFIYTDVGRINGKRDGPDDRRRDTKRRRGSAH